MVFEQRTEYLPLSELDDSRSPDDRRELESRYMVKLSREGKGEVAQTERGKEVRGDTVGRLDSAGYNIPVNGGICERKPANIWR